MGRRPAKGDDGAMVASIKRGLDATQNVDLPMWLVKEIKERATAADVDWRSVIVGALVRWANGECGDPDQARRSAIASVLDRDVLAT
jgi:hypothetical protein